MKLIVGLGNPGKEYELARHNAGWLILDALATKLRAESWRTDETFEGSVSEWGTGESRVLLLKPTTFMNNSGRAVERVRAYYKLDSTDIVVVHDELDLPLGTVRTRLGGHTAGHNGVGSLLHHLGTDQFWRVRVGVDGGQPSRATDTVNYVLQRFGADEQALATKIVDETASHLVEWLEQGIVDTSFTVSH